jgi:PhnB protein
MFVEDVDALLRQALDAGATELTPPLDAFWGDRFASFADPFGHERQVAARKEDLTPEEVMERGKEAMASKG